MSCLLDGRNGINCHCQQSDLSVFVTVIIAHRTQCSNSYEKLDCNNFIR